MNKLKYLGYDIVFQEVPNEVTLAINISGCPHKCEGCHSKYLWEYEGEFITDDLPDLISKYKDMITCVCFMGGEQNIEELKYLLEYVRINGLKTCLYSGVEELAIIDAYLIIDYLDYLKLGSYRNELGGLDSKETNQRMYEIDENSVTEITEKFWK